MKPHHARNSSQENALAALRTVILLLGAIYFLPLVQAEVAVQAWVQRYNHPAESLDGVRKIVVDSTGNSIVAGYTDDGLTRRDILLVKYAPDGTALWTNRYNSRGNLFDDVSAVATDVTGNVFVAGYSYTNTQSVSDFVTLAYSSTGTPLWTNNFGDSSTFSSQDRPVAIAVDGSGAVVVAGNVHRNHRDFATLKYSPAGVPLWTNRFDHGGEDSASGLALDAGGNVFVTGYSHGSNTWSDFATVAYSSAGTPLWTNRYHRIANSSEWAYNIGVDSGGHIVVSGYSSNPTNADYTVIKYTNDGIPLWTNLYDGPGNAGDAAYAMAIDAADNIYLTGESRGSTSFNDYATVKYSPAGEPLWTNRYGLTTNSSDSATALVLDGNQDVIVTGTSGTVKYSSAGVPLWTNAISGILAGDGISNFFVGVSFPGGGTNADFLTIKYATTGNSLWTNRYTGVANKEDLPKAVVSDRNGDIIVTGHSYASFFEYLTLKYSAAGVPLWTNRFRDVGDNEAKATAIALDGSGNVFVTGSAHGTATGQNSYDYVTIKYSSAGTPLWTNRYRGPIFNGEDQAVAIGVDAVGDVFVTGSSTGFSLDYATIKYANNGTPLWTNRYNGPVNRDDVPVAMVLDTNGNVIVTGYAYFTNSFALSDFLTIKYSGAGVPLWTNRYAGPGNGEDQPTAIAVDRSNNVIVTGYSLQSSARSFVTIKYSSPGVPLWTNRLAAGYGQPNDVAVDGSGNVYVTGYYYPLIAALYGPDYFTVKYSAAGVPLWTNRYNTPGHGNEYADAIEIDAAGNILVTGFTDSAGTTDFLTLGYASDGTLLWTNRYNGPANGAEGPWTSKSMATTPDGVVVVGISDDDTSATENTDFVILKYITTVKLTAQLVNKTMLVSWPTSHLGWRLEMQTNAVNVGLRTNWISVAGSTATNRMSFPLPSTPRTAFFRLSR